jgi:Ca2+/Na+ antiporter
MERERERERERKRVREREEKREERESREREKERERLREHLKVITFSHCMFLFFPVPKSVTYTQISENMAFLYCCLYFLFNL